VPSLQAAPNAYAASIAANKGVGAQITKAQASQQATETQQNWWKKPLEGVVGAGLSLIPGAGPLLSTAWGAATGSGGGGGGGLSGLLGGGKSGSGDSTGYSGADDYNSSAGAYGPSGE
jgi:hypothetical protein